MLWWTLLKLSWGPRRARLNAAVELGQLRTRRAVEPLIAALDRTPEIRTEVATALGRIGDPRAANALMAVLLDKRAPTRSAAVWALGEVGDTRATGPLAAVLATDGESDVCEAAALALIRLYDARGIVRGVPILVASIRRGARGRAPHYDGVGETLVQIGAPAVGPLIELLRHDDQDVQALAIRTLGQLGDVTAVEPLIATLKHGSVPMRRASAEALAKLGVTRATEALVMSLGDPDPEVRQISAGLLARSGPRVVQLLIDALTVDDPDHRREVARVLAALRDVRSVMPLIEATQDPDQEVRWAAADALIAIGDRRAIEALVRLLMRGDIVPSVYLRSLLGILQRLIHAVPVEILLELMQLEYVLGLPTGLDGGNGFSRAREHRVDCEEFRTLARQELTRRGIQTTR